MVRICNTEYPKDKKIDIGVDFELDHFQKYAIESIILGNHILIICFVMALVFVVYNSY